MNWATDREHAMLNRQPWIIVVCLGLFLVAGTSWWFHTSSSPSATPLPLVPESLQTKLESSVHPLRVRFQGQGEAAKETTVLGSCIAIPTPGMFLTATHNLSPVDKQSEIRILLDGQEEPAKILYRDEKTDTAVLQLSRYEGAALQFSRNAPQKGQTVYLFGFPTKYAGAAYPELIGTSAIIEDLDYGYRNEEIGVDTKVLRLKGVSELGGSGGAVVSEDGELIGMIVATQFVSETSRNVTHVLAIPWETLRSALHPRKTSDVDGDGIRDGDDAFPFIAAYPNFEIRVTDFEVGLARETEFVERAWKAESRTKDEESTIASWRMNATEYLKRTTHSEATRTAVGGARVASFSFPASFHGFDTKDVGEEIRAERSRFRVDQTDIDTLRHRVARKLLAGRKDRIGPKAGYLKLQVEFSNYGSVAFALEDFEINVSANGKLWETFAASRCRNGFLPRRFVEPQEKPDRIMLTFDEINTQQILNWADFSEGLSLEFEVAQPSLKLNPESFQRQLPAIRESCAKVNLIHGSRRQTHYVSCRTFKGLDAIPLEDFVKRIPCEERDIHWGRGALGDFLARFAGRDGADVLYPGREGPPGLWQISNNGKPLVGDIRRSLVKPGGRLQVRYLTAEEYWGRPVGWKGYTKAYQKLRVLHGQESVFWDRISELGRPGEEEWNAVNKNTTRDRARELLRKYREYFDDPNLPLPIRANYPNANRDIEAFRRWLTEEDFRFPRFRLELQKAETWWNVGDDRELEVVFELKIGDQTFKSQPEQFQLANGQNSGEILLSDVPNGARTFFWSPFDRVEFHVTDHKSGDPLLHYEAKDIQSAALLLEEQKLEKIVDPNISKIELLFRVEDNDGVPIRQDQFPSAFKKRVPRVTHPVPTEDLLAEGLAFRFSYERDPAIYRHVAVLFEDLLASDETKPRRWGTLARAMEANFYSLDFRRCRELADQLSDVPDRDIEDSEYFIPGMNASDLRKWGQVAAAAEKLPTDDAQLKILTRYIFHRLSFLRLIREDSMAKAEDKAALTKWKQELESQIRLELTPLDSLDHSIITSYIREEYRKLLDRIRNLR